jgi:hypothetical protein
MEAALFCKSTSGNLFATRMRGFRVEWDPILKYLTRPNRNSLPAPFPIHYHCYVTMHVLEDSSVHTCLCSRNVVGGAHSKYIGTAIQNGNRL